jgi:hypothetical protein
VAGDTFSKMQSGVISGNHTREALIQIESEGILGQETLMKVKFHEV